MKVKKIYPLLLKKCQKSIFFTTWRSFCRLCTLGKYSRVHIRSDKAFCKKTQKKCILHLFWAYVGLGEPDHHIGLVKSFTFASIQFTQGPIPEIFAKKYWELAELENETLFWFWFFKRKMFFLIENHHGFHMRCRLFLHYGWCLQNLGKDFIRTNMHTTVCMKCVEYCINCM